MYDRKRNINDDLKKFVQKNLNFGSIGIFFDYFVIVTVDCDFETFFVRNCDNLFFKHTRAGMSGCLFNLVFNSAHF